MIAGCLVIGLVLGLLTPETGAAETITMTTLYDNYLYEAGTIPDWGFACFIEGTERTILFDTGYQSDLLLHNIAALQIDIGTIDDIVISHDHLDHTGGLSTILGLNGDVNVYFGASFPAAFEQTIVAYGATPIRVSEPIEICRDVYSTGELSGPVDEQGLAIDTQQGLAVITGCSHPDISQILQRALEVTNRDIHIVFGGLHLMNHGIPAIQQIISSFHAIGVEQAGPTHCTGDTAIQLFQQSYGENCVAMGTGRVIELPAVTSVVDPAAPADRLLELAVLEPNVPNPFNPATEIIFSLSEPARVRLRIRDAGGHVLRTLELERRGAGRHEVRWDGRDDRGRPAPSGVYFCCLEVGDARDTRRMTLIR